jgi:hypothetical protein
MSEFYDNGTVKAAMTSRVCSAKPKNTCQKLSLLDAYNDWYENRAEAEAALAEARREGKVA